MAGTSQSFDGQQNVKKYGFWGFYLSIRLKGYIGPLTLLPFIH